MLLDLLVLAALVATYLACLAVWRRKREILKYLNTPLDTDLTGDTVIGAITALDLIHQLATNAPGLLAHVENLHQMADPHVALGVGQIITPHAISNAVAAGHLSPEHLAHAFASTHIYSIDTADGFGDLHHHLDGFVVAHVESADAVAMHLNHLNLADVTLHVPIVALVVKGWQNWQKLELGQLNGVEWGVHTTLGAAGAATGGAAGMYAGSSLALAIIPLLGPLAPLAVVLVPLGAFAGVRWTSKLVQWGKIWYYGRAEFRPAKKALEAAQEECWSRCRQLRDAFVGGFHSLLHAARRQHKTHLAATRQLLRSQGGFIQRLRAPTPLSVGLEQSIKRSKREFKGVTIPYYRGLLTQVQRLQPTQAGRFLFNQGKHRFLGVAALETAHDRVQWAVLDVQEKQLVAQRIFDETVLPKL
ncbi:MAG: hypothetical protein JO040_10540 [Gemmatimonadetes bacterium]|nr:hypothetical protein [Gemmatimonadota bacterium]